MDNQLQELISTLKSIDSTLKRIESKLDGMQGNGRYHSLSDIVDSLGSTYDLLTEICHRVG